MEYLFAVLIPLVIFLYFWGKMRERIRELEVRLENEKKGEEGKKDLLQNLSQEAVRQSTSSFLEMATLRLKPVEEALQRFQREVSELEKSRTFAYATLLEQVKGLQVTQEALKNETKILGRSLRMPHARGRWGEIQLKRVVEMAGMTAHVDFLEQTSYRDDGVLKRPDLLILLPQGKRIIVDAKAPLQAYLDSLEAADEEGRKEKLKEHAKQVKQHLQMLGSKTYWDKLEPTPEFVVLFLPGETFFSGALEEDPTLIEYGMERKVLLSTPTTLIALLKSVAYGWKQEALTRHAEEISQLGKTLYDRIKSFSGHLGDVRKGLEKAVEGYNKAVSSYESRLLVAARRFEGLSIGTEGDLETLGTVDLVARPLAAHVQEQDSLIGIQK
jgi:DNA recombination protein RmuC